MIEMLKKIFNTNPKKPIVLKSRCSDCRDDVIIKITSTSGGFGIQGGALLGCSSSTYFIKCYDCFNVNPEIQNFNKLNHASVHYVV
jgi:hypothetical protein